MPDSLNITHQVPVTEPVSHHETAPAPAKEREAASHPSSEAPRPVTPKKESASPADTTATTTVTTDSITAVHTMRRNALEPLTCHEVDGPRVLHLRNATLGRVPYSEGIAPSPRATLPGYDPGVNILLIILFLIISANVRHYSTFIKTFTQDLFTVRRRANVFDESNTMSETRVLLSLTTLTCICEGILLYSAIAPGDNRPAPFAGVVVLSFLAALYYLWQLAAYSTVGYIFSTSADTSQWIKGFNASQSLLGLGLVVPALLSLFNPGLTPLLLSLSIFLYIVARIIFISKGYRIFYENYTSLVYFILYLCTLEIIPSLIFYRLASSISAII